MSVCFKNVEVTGFMGQLKKYGTLWDTLGGIWDFLYNWEDCTSSMVGIQYRLDQNTMVGPHCNTNHTTLWYNSITDISQLYDDPVCSMCTNSMVVPRCTVYWSHLWTTTETVAVACSRLYRRERDDGTHDQREIYSAQYSEYSRPHHSTSNDAAPDTHRHT